MEVVEHPSYYSLRGMIYFLNQQKRIKKLRVKKKKVNLEIGFVPLTACAPLAVAKEKAFHPWSDEVTLVRETARHHRWHGQGLLMPQMPALACWGHENRPVPVVSARQ